MAIGALDAFVVDVNDLAVAERFWAAVSGLPLKYSGWTGKISRLGDPPASIMLQLVPERKSAIKNRAHLDFVVEDVAAAVAQVLDLGGSVVRGARLLLRAGFLRPGAGMGGAGRPLRQRVLPHPRAVAGPTGRAASRVRHDRGPELDLGQAWALTRAEFDRVELHTMLSEQMLRRSPALAALGPVAAAHHEKADGSGYHRRLHGDATERGARVLSATDIYVGLTTERADRPALTDGHAATEVPAGVDGRAWWRCASGCSRCRQKGR